MNINRNISIEVRKVKSKESAHFANIKNMEWLMADAVDSIYDLFD
jgi:hypothetical protein